MTHLLTVCHRTEHLGLMRLLWTWPWMDDTAVLAWTGLGPQAAPDRRLDRAAGA